jgi:hypothetical protein
MDAAEVERYKPVQSNMAGADVISNIPSHVEVFCVQAKWPSKGTATSDISFLVRSERLLAHDVTSGDTEHTKGRAE